MRALIALLLFVAAASASEAQGASASVPLPPPGRLIDLGGWRLHLNCTGVARAARPTVVLEAGAGDFSVDWSLVQPEVSRFARVCSYDRAGSAWSDLGPRPRTIRQRVWELHALLEEAGERRPYVLVGHSLGALLVRAFQSTYASDVAAMLLVEGGSDDPLRMMPDGKVVRSSTLSRGQPIPEVKTAGPLRIAEVPKRIIELIESQLPEQVRHANDPPRNKLPVDAQRMRTWTLGQLQHALSNDNPVEAEELASIRAQRNTGEYPLGNLPLIVMTRGVPEDGGARTESDEAEHRQEHAAIAHLSRAGKLVVATRSGHHVPLDEPMLVVAAIQELIGTPVTTPDQGSSERGAILDAVRARLKLSSRFRVDHVRVAGNWAFLRATEVVPLDGGEQQETDLTVAALLERPAASAPWRVTDHWTLPTEEKRPFAEFKRRVQQRLRAERLPSALLPDDL